jgi:cytochrome c nitrite reductase small subunit
VSGGEHEEAARPARARRAASLAAAVLSGVAAGLGVYTFVYAEGASYLTDDPAACANCHVMRTHHDAWTRSTHHAVASCNDCHAPHAGRVAALAVKARNGLKHSLAFTTGLFHEPIRIGPANRGVTESACRYCHEDVVLAIDADPAGRELECIRCHAAVGHDL